ncbi:MAG: enoyl-CoA hydratase/isomerase family protein [Candidatus Geothermincolales bacterium]
MDGKSAGVVLKKEGELARLVISRPERMNVLQPGDLRLLWQYMVTIEADERARLVALEGEGEKAFCAGLDLSTWAGADLAEMRKRAREASLVVNRLAELALPKVALVRGVAAGLGLELCLACDFILAEEGSRFGFPEVRLGLVPWMGGIRRLVGAVGEKRTTEMVLLGGMVDAGKAAEWGLVNEVVPRGGLERALEKLLNGLLQGSKAAQLAAARALRSSRDGYAPFGLDQELESLVSCLALGDGRERISDLLEKRAGGRTTGTGQEPGDGPDE